MASSKAAGLLLLQPLSGVLADNATLTLTEACVSNALEPPQFSATSVKYSKLLELYQIHVEPTVNIKVDSLQEWHFVRAVDEEKIEFKNLLASIEVCNEC